ncbi:MAG TPA: type II toxin-antitoxin system RatA family toxin [Burkholderiales bacterium]|nr:type II toxin-antitoxin system RatA family toxin [Burkholderiales bacterium]
MYGAAEMFALVADVASYPKFLPWCGGAHLMKQEPNLVEAAITIAYKGVNKTFVTRNTLQPNESMEMKLVEGPFRHLHGLWRFTPLDERACKIEFELEFEAANRVVGAVLNPVFHNIANHMVDAFHKRAVELYGKR